MSIDIGLGATTHDTTPSAKLPRPGLPAESPTVTLGSYAAAVERLRTAPVSVEIHTVYQVGENRYFTTDPETMAHSVHKDMPCIRLDGDLYTLGDIIDDKQRAKAELRAQALEKIEGLLTPAEIDALRDVIGADDFIRCVE